MLPYYQLAFMEIIHRSTGISTYITLEIIEQINSFNQKLACDTFLQLCGFVYEVYEPHRQIRASGGVTGGFGWVQTHPLSKKAPMRFFRNPKNFWGVGGWVEREKA